jgi:hypothetical protein
MSVEVQLEPIDGGRSVIRIAGELHLSTGDMVGDAGVPGRDRPD